MPPILALILCTAFVLFLLRIDREQSVEVSSVLWVPTVWMLYTSSKPLAAWFGVSGENMEAGSPWDRSFQIALIVLGLCILTFGQREWRGLLGRQPWLKALVAYILISVLWSDIPFISLKRSLREVLAVLMGLLIATEFDPRQSLVALFRRTIYILIPFSLLLIKYYPDLGAQYGRWSGKLMWIGVAMQKNGLGLLCLLSAFFLVWTFACRWLGLERPPVKYQKSAELFLLGLSLWLLKGAEGAYSATSVAVLVAVLAAFGGLLWRHRSQKIPGAVAIAFVLGFLIVWGIAAPLGGVSQLASLTSTVGRDATLTGRTEIWAGLLPAAMDNPVFGCGFGGFWTTEMAETHLENSAHNGYLDSLLQLGFVGLLLLAGFLISSGLQARQLLAQDFAYGSLWLCCLIMAVLHNISESSFDTFTRTLTALLVFFSVCLPALMDRLDTDMENSQTAHLDNPDFSPPITHVF